MIEYYQTRGKARIPEHYGDRLMREEFRFFRIDLPEAADNYQDSDEESSDSEGRYYSLIG